MLAVRRHQIEGIHRLDGIGILSDHDDAEAQCLIRGDIRIGGVDQARLDRRAGYRRNHLHRSTWLSNPWKSSSPLRSGWSCSRPRQFRSSNSGT